MKFPLWIAVMFLLAGVQGTFGWNDDEYAKIKASVATNGDPTSGSGVLLNSAAKAADVAMFYHLQGNVAQADQWLAVAWQDYQQAQAPVKDPSSPTPPASSPAAPSGTPSP